MIVDSIEIFIKLLGINLCITYCFFKIINYKKTSCFINGIIIFLNILISIFNVFLKESFHPIFLAIVIYFLYSILMNFITKNIFSCSIITTILSVSICYIVCTISAAFLSIFELLLHIDLNNIIFVSIVNFIVFSILYLLFKLHRFKDGFQFIKNKKQNDYFEIFTLLISLVIIYMYFMIGNYQKIHPKYLFFEFLLSVLIMLIVLRKTFIIYQNKKLLEKTLKEYKQEIIEKDEKINSLLSEESKIIKANHEFFHRQEALKHKLIDLKVTNRKFNKDYLEILSRIDTISEEYKNSTGNLNIKHNLPKCYISELDDMFSYMQNECENNNIEFILKINGNIHSLINNIIPKNKLETLIGDLIKNSIIAINHSDNKFRSIMTILGIKDEYFEFCIYDSGIEFELNTLSKLGIEKASTHLDTGGTGIGFITTFETLRKYNASIIINEFSQLENNYTKSITILFNDKFEYIINSYREAEIFNVCKNRNDIILKSNFIH